MCHLGQSKQEQRKLRSPVIHQESSPRPAAAGPPELPPGSCHGRRSPARATSATFSSASASHRTMVITWIRDLETCSRSFKHPLESMRCADGVVHTVQFAGDLHLASRTAQSLALPAHVIPCPELLCALRQLVDLLRLARSGCATTNTNNQLLCATSHIIALILPSPWGPVWLANPLFTAQRSANIRLPTLRSHPGSPSITLYLSIRSTL